MFGLGRTPGMPHILASAPGPRANTNPGSGGTPGGRPPRAWLPAKGRVRSSGRGSPRWDRGHSSAGRSSTLRSRAALQLRPRPDRRGLGGDRSSPTGLPGDLGHICRASRVAARVGGGSPAAERCRARGGRRRSQAPGDGVVRRRRLTTPVHRGVGCRGPPSRSLRTGRVSALPAIGTIVDPTERAVGRDPRRRRQVDSRPRRLGPRLRTPAGIRRCCRAGRSRSRLNRIFTPKPHIVCASVERRAR